MRQIALINHSTLADAAEVRRCLAALQTQVTRDFASTWGISARLRAADQPAADEEPLFLFDDLDQADALGPQHRGIGTRPCGFVFLHPCRAAGEPWQAAASHELLELLADPLVNLSAEGVFQGKPAWFALEVCDPVAGDEYEIDDVPVANFVLPSWFWPGSLPDETLVDFLGRLADPFTLSPGGHATLCMELGRWQPWFARRCPSHRRQAGTYSRRRRRGARGR